MRTAAPVELVVEKPDLVCTTFCLASTSAAVSVMGAIVGVVPRGKQPGCAGGRACGARWGNPAVVDGQAIANTACATMKLPTKRLDYL